MICTHCGKEVPDTAKVCGYCGHRLKAVPSPPSAAAPKRGLPGWAWGLGGAVVVVVLVGVLLATGVIRLPSQQAPPPTARWVSQPTAVTLPTSIPLPTATAVPPTATPLPLPTATLPAAAPTATEPTVAKGEVPDVVGMSMDTAVATLEAAGFEAIEREQRVEVIASESLEIRTVVVLAQSPEAGVKAPLGSTVEIVIPVFVVAKGAVPDVVGMSMDTAVATLQTTGFEAIAVEKEVIVSESSEMVSVVVLEQSPEAGVEIPLGSAVEIVIPVPHVVPPATPTATPTSLPPTSTRQPTATPTPRPPTFTPQPTATATSVPPTSTPQPTASPTSRPPASTPQPTPAAPYGVVITFEQWDTWRRGDQPYGELTQTKEQVRSGSYAAKLRYDFPVTDDDFVVFVHPLSLAEQPNTISAWVYGDGSGHYLNVWIEDAEGENWSIHLGQVDSAGWQEMAGILDPTLPWPSGHLSGPDNGVMDYPVRFYALVLDRPGSGPQSGQIYIDDISVWRR
jgi:beta-lactam-binding protein with PASTA domain